MDCNYTTIKTCELKGSTFRSHLLNFGDFDISEYTFSAGFSNGLGQKLNDVDLEKVGNSVILPLTSIENKSGHIRSDVWMENEGNKDLAVRFNISISDADCGCTDDTTHDITITYQELVIPVTVTQAIVNINLDYESLTPEQQSDLRFDWEDFTPENITELQAPAIEAATIAATATQNANEATEAAQVATEEAQTATTAANEATADATTATNNANQAAVFATSATQEAATATGEATAAASSANSAATAANAGAASAEAKAILADTAASNAQTKATLADSAAANANDKAALAQAATTNANTATSAANTATNAANTAAAAASNAKGWQPLLVMDSTTIAGKSLLKLTDWTGGTGTKPTTNVGKWLKGDGTYTSIASEANDLKGASGDNLIASYTHNGNRVVRISSLDVATGIFTTIEPHNLSAGQSIFLNFDNVGKSPTYDVAPFELQSTTYNTRPFVPVVNRVIGVNQFTIKNIQNSGDLLFNINGTANANIDLSRFHFEIISPFTITGLALDECFIRIGAVFPSHPQAEFQINGNNTFLRMKNASPFNYMTYFIQFQRINGVLQGFYHGAGSVSRTSPTSANFAANIQSASYSAENTSPTFGGQANLQINTLIFNSLRSEFLNGTKITILR